VIDMRSVDAASLRTLVDQIGAIAARAAGRDLQQLGMQAIYDASSTDANVPISAGIPAICIGITHGGLGHTTNEYIETSPIDTGVTQLALLSIAATSALAGSQRA
jgi:acetylornithine deacetylase/succinyl-diaminopimelate desuccinylase-like protein